MAGVVLPIFESSGLYNCFDEANVSPLYSNLNRTHFQGVGVREDEGKVELRMSHKRSNTKVKIALEISGELAQTLEEYINRGLFTSKPEIVRAALRCLFDDLKERDLLKARLKMISE